MGAERIAISAEKPDNNASARRKPVRRHKTQEGRETVTRIATVPLATMALLCSGVAFPVGDVFVQAAKNVVGTWTLVSACGRCPQRATSPCDELRPESRSAKPVERGE
jgi:hypothetical protein